MCGAGQLIELRGPESFQTDFELSLFMTHAGPIVSVPVRDISTAYLDPQSNLCFVMSDHRSLLKWQNMFSPRVPLAESH